MNNYYTQIYQNLLLLKFNNLEMFYKTALQQITNMIILLVVLFDSNINVIVIQLVILKVFDVKGDLNKFIYFLRCSI